MFGARSKLGTFKNIHLLGANQKLTLKASATKLVLIAIAICPEKLDSLRVVAQLSLDSSQLLYYCSDTSQAAAKMSQLLK